MADKRRKRAPFPLMGVNEFHEFPSHSRPLIALMTPRRTPRVEFTTSLSVAIREVNSRWRSASAPFLPSSLPSLPPLPGGGIHDYPETTRVIGASSRRCRRLSGASAPPATRSSAEFPLIRAGDTRKRYVNARCNLHDNTPPTRRGNAPVGVAKRYRRVNKSSSA